MNEDRVDSAVRTLGRLPAPVRWSDVERRAAGGEPDDLAPARSDRRALVAVVALAAAVTVVAGLVALWPSAPSTTSVRTTPGASRLLPTTTTMPTDPLVARVGPVSALTETEYLVWGGEVRTDDPRRDGFAVQIASGRVRAVPEGPIGARDGATGVWTGTELLVCCGSLQGPSGFRREFGTGAAAYDPGTTRWRVLATPPATIAPYAADAVWTGDRMVVVTLGAAASYDPVTDRWVDLAAPAFDRQPEAVWTGEEVVVWDRRYGVGRIPPSGNVADAGWRWRPGRSWEPLPALPAGSRTSKGSMAWTGEEVVVWGQSTATPDRGVGARWFPGDGTWRPTSPSPQGSVDTYEGTNGSQAVSVQPERRRVVVRALDGNPDTPLFTYDPSSDRWASTDLAVPGYRPSITVIGDGVYVPDPARPLVGRLP